ncbi:MAG: xanthine dehydrogenase family protein molybdopterin-binding subunit [Calditrichia bacterium]|nr:xanthine dehydrogenase family protein molybdopterin-binding subunit [Calditrichia bacterium]
MPRKEKLFVGINKDLEEITVPIPDADPKPWDGKDELKYIGKKVPRIDGTYKTTGRAKYTFDIKVPGMIYGKIIRSPYPAAMVTKIDSSQAEKLPGVRSIIRVKDELPFPVRFAGQEVVALAADTEHLAQEAADLVKIEYDQKPFVVDLDEAMKENAPLVFDPKDEEKDKVKNVRDARIYPKDGKSEEIDAVLNSSDHKIEATYRTQVQTHCPMETHGVVAKWNDEKLTIWASTQGTFMVRNQVADHFNIPKSDIRVITKFMGGGFGSKLKADTYTMLAVKLAREAKKPVRLMLSRKEDHLSTGNRPNSLQTVTVGATKEGKITGIKLKSFGTAGIGRGAGTGGPARFIYDAEKIYTEESDVYTNAGPSAPFRAPGHPQGAFAFEQTIDDMAYKIGMDPLEFRIKNSESDKVRQAEYKIGAEKFGWLKRNPKPGAEKGVIKTGAGLANSLWYYIYSPGSHVSLRVNDDGSVQLRSGVQDIGGGIVTPMAMIIAEELCLKPTDIKITIGDTEFGLAPTSGGSQTTAGLTPAVRNAAYSAKQRLLKIAAGLMEVDMKEVKLSDGGTFSTIDSKKQMIWKEVTAEIPEGQFSVTGERMEDYYETKRWKISGVQFAEVKVDTETGSIKVKRMVAIHDCGRPMDRLTIESQINGGIIQGISFAFYENRILDRNTGVMVNPNLEQYKIAGARDVPPIESHIIDLNLGQSSTGAIGVGEPATIPTAAAIANAVYHAIGVRIREMPMTPSVVLKALNKV